MPSQSLVTVGGKITAANTNTTITNANAEGTTGIVPTAATGTGVVLGTNGVVTLTAATAPDVRGIFSSTYDNYEIHYDVTLSAAAFLNGQFTLVGAASAVSYAGSVGADTSAAHTAAALPTTVLQFAAANAVAGGRSVGVLEIFGPAKAATSLFLGRATTQTAAATVTVATYGGLHTVSTAYDGILFGITGGGTVSGTIRFIGKNNN